MVLESLPSWEKRRTGRVFDLAAMTDDTAPDYDGLTVAYTTVVSTVLVAITVGIVWLLEDTVVGRLADAGFGTAGTGTYGLVLLGFAVVFFAVAAVGRYLGIRAIATRNDYLLVGVTAAQVIAVGILLTIALELYVGIVTNRLLWIVTGGAVGFAALGNLLVLATDRNFSAAGNLGLTVTYLIGLALVAAAFLWWFSLDGPIWNLYLLTWDVILFGLFPVYLLAMYIHDVWRIASENHPPTVGALASYTAITGLLLMPLEVVYGVLLSLAKSGNESA